MLFVWQRQADRSTMHSRFSKDNINTVCKETNSQLHEQPGNNTAPIGANKLLKPEGGYNEAENLQK